MPNPNKSVKVGVMIVLIFCSIAVLPMVILILQGLLEGFDGSALDRLLDKLKD